MVLPVLGSFDSLNPLIVKGSAASGIREHVYESLMARAFDEPFSLYGLLAESVETPEDRSWVAFTLNPQARFSDGHPVTAGDVVFSHALLRDHGRPNHRFYYAKVTKVETIGERTVRFTFDSGGDREMPLIMGLMPVLPRHLVTPESFDRTGFAPPVGSGPYTVAEVKPGASIAYRRNPDYWGRNLPVNAGHYNFDEIRYDYYRDGTSMFEAFKKGLFDIRIEDDPARWKLGYDFPARREGKVVLEEMALGVPAGMSALVFNTRKPPFDDVRVRRALALLFDFEWINANLYHGLYARTRSYFDRSFLSSFGTPADARERELLAPYRDAARADVMEGGNAFLAMGETDSRARLRRALALLKQAGYELRAGKLVAAGGEPFGFELLAATKGQERLFLTFARALARAGIDARVRLVDSAQYQRRRQIFDFDMIQAFWPASLSPGNEQSFRWSAQAAAAEGSFNFAGVKNPAVDAMIAAVLAAKEKEDFVSAVRALDRVLLSGDYVIPLFHLPAQWLARRERLRHPDADSLYGFLLDVWWEADAAGKGQ
ncbi:MAG: extracellular solute-binding protein [Hyphomicrobiales bacterium]